MKTFLPSFRSAKKMVAWVEIYPFLFKFAKYVLDLCGGAPSDARRVAILPQKLKPASAIQHWTQYSFKANQLTLSVRRLSRMEAIFALVI
jgi:hypothetical protein